MFRSTMLVFLALVVASAVAQDQSQADSHLAWQDVSSQYKTFSEIKPILVNGGQRSIYLSRIWPHGSAQLQRLSESTGNWESGAWSGGCGTVSHATVPIEISPQEEKRIDVYWQLSTDDWNNPEHFVVNESRASHAERSVTGRYRFVLRYALEPWTLVHHPHSIFTIVSPEFVVSGP